MLTKKRNSSTLTKKPVGDSEDENLRRQQWPAEPGGRRRAEASSVSTCSQPLRWGPITAARWRRLPNDRQPRINRSCEGSGWLKSLRQYLRKLNAPLMRHWILNDNRVFMRGHLRWLLNNRAAAAWWGQVHSAGQPQAAIKRLTQPQERGNKWEGQTKASGHRVRAGTRYRAGPGSLC